MISRGLHEITAALNHPDILREMIHFPGTHEERQSTIAKNMVQGMPGTLGFIDGTLVKIVTPRTPENQVYRSRKGWPALNVQIVCDAHTYIMNVNARFPGSANDAYIYRSSPVRPAMMTAFEESRCWLLGDSGYAHEPWLMMPLPHAEVGTPEYHYTKLHCHARNVVERCIGILKARWRCLLTDRTLHYEPEKAGLIVNACVVLHNYLIMLRVPEPAPVVEDLGHDPLEVVLEEDLQLHPQADEVRRYLINYAVERRRRLYGND